MVFDLHLRLDSSVTGGRAERANARVGSRDLAARRVRAGPPQGPREGLGGGGQKDVHNRI